MVMGEHSQMSPKSGGQTDESRAAAGRLRKSRISFAPVTPMSKGCAGLSWTGPAS